tara:strand:+ start:506 stop:853 length:348 start_codon:yes stop_codon:yes gene_type:complete
MKKLIFTIFFCILLSTNSNAFFFGKNNVEKCADEKTRMYWGMRALDFLKQIGVWEQDYKNSKDKYERNAIKLTIEEKKYWYELYKNASKKSLDEKLSEFPEFEKNYSICKKQYSK